MSPTVEQQLSVNISTDVSVEFQLRYQLISRLICWLICRPTHLDRYIGQVSVDMSTDTQPIYWSRGAQNTHDPNSLSGKPLRVVEQLGYTSRQYQTALEKLDQKYGSEKRLLQRHLEAILHASRVKETNLKELEIFSDRLTNVVVKLEVSDQH